MVHAAAAMTYTLLVLLAAVLAKGRVQGGAGWARALLAAGLMLSPQLGATSILLLSPDHTGTAVPLLVIWLLIDRVRPTAGRPRVGRAAGGLRPADLTMVGDSIVLLTGIVPLVLVGAGRACAGLIRRGKRDASAVVRAEPGRRGGRGRGGRLVRAAGHGRPGRVPAVTRRDRHGPEPAAARVLGDPPGLPRALRRERLQPGFFGARPALEVVFVAVHLAGAILAIWALGVGLVRIFRLGELIVPVFAVAIVANLGAYMISTHAQDLLGAREMAAVLPLGAVLAGLLLGDRIAAWTRAARRWFVPALAVLTPPVTWPRSASAPPSRPLRPERAAGQLAGGARAHPRAGQHWQANSTTVASGGRVVVSAVVAPTAAWCRTCGRATS